MENKLKTTLFKGFPFSVIWLILLLQCKSEVPYIYVCKDGLSDFQEIKTLRTFQNINEKDTLLTLIIRTGDEYQRFLKERTINIDFTEQTLIGGRYYASSTDYIVGQTLKSFCSLNLLYYDIKLQRGAGQIFTYVPFFILVPKIPNDTQVQFHVHH